MNKIYTSIEQSKKLIELGIDVNTADMCWCNNSIKGVNYTDKFSANLYTVKEMKDVFDTALNGWDKYWKLIPCWSLATLLQYLKELKPLVYLPVLFVNDNKWTLQFVERGHGNTEEIISDNPVDACFEMILLLNEQKLL